MSSHGDSTPPHDVWIVLDEAPDAPELVLGVFSSTQDANRFFESLDAAEYPGAALGSYQVDWNFRDGNSRHRA